MSDEPDKTRPINLVIPIQVSQSFNIQKDEETNPETDLQEV